MRDPETAAKRAHMWVLITWIAVPAFVLAGVLLACCITNLIKLARRSMITSVPLLERQEVSFSQAHRVTLWVKGPRFTTRFAGLKYELKSPDGAPVESHAVWMRPQVSGMKKVRLGVRTFDIPRPDTYVLEIHGLTSDDLADTNCEIVFTQSHRMQSVANVLGIVFAGLVLLGSLVVFLVRFIVASS